MEKLKYSFVSFKIMPSKARPVAKVESLIFECKKAVNPHLFLKYKYDTTNLLFSTPGRRYYI